MLSDHVTVNHRIIETCWKWASFLPQCYINCMLLYRKINLWHLHTEIDLHEEKQITWFSTRVSFLLWAIITVFYLSIQQRKYAVLFYLPKILCCIIKNCNFAIKENKKPVNLRSLSFSLSLSSLFKSYTWPNG